MPDLPLCLGVLKHRALLARENHLPAKMFFYDGCLLMWCSFKFKGVLFRSDSRHNDRVDSLICPKSGTAYNVLLVCKKKHGFVFTRTIFTYYKLHRNMLTIHNFSHYAKTNDIHLYITYICKCLLSILRL